LPTRTPGEPQGFRLHGRAPGAEDESNDQAAAHSGEDALIERVRTAHRFDRRGPSLRLVEPVPTVTDPASAIAGHVAAAVGADRFARAFDGQARIVVQGNVVEIRAGGRAAAGLIERRFGPAIREATGAVLGPAAELRFVVEAAQPAVETAPAAVAAPAPVRREAAPREAAGSAARGRAYRLEEFVVGESNRLAYNAAVQMADDELGQIGGTGAPLFIHGPCGVGKTHLLQGIANRFRERHPGATIRVVSGEAFLNEFVAAVRHGGGSNMTGQSRSVAGSGGIERFRRQYRRCDLLCLDDVHILASKQATQQELLHTFDQIAQSGARIAMACDQHPRQMKSGDGGFSPALVSRFLSGMVAGVDAPDATVRERAARMFAQRRGLNLEEGALRLLVERTQTVPGQTAISVRDLEGVLTRVEAVHRLGTGGGAGPVGVLAVERALGMVGGDGASGGSSAVVRRPIRAEQIIAHTCMALGVERSDLGASTRHKRVVLARAVITHLCRELTTMSYPEIARAIGRPSHSTVITAHQRLTKQIEADEVFGIGAGGEAMTVGGLVRQLVAAITRG
jgi:chromosomal replication initiator protein